MTNLYAIGTSLFILAGLAPEQDRLLTLIMGIAVVVVCYYGLRRIRRLNRMQRACNALRNADKEYRWRFHEKKKHQLQTA